MRLFCTVASSSKWCSSNIPRAQEGKSIGGSRNLSLWCSQPQVQGLWLNPCTSNQGLECCTHPCHTCLGMCAGPVAIGLQRPCRVLGLQKRGGSAGAVQMHPEHVFCSLPQATRQMAQVIPPFLTYG